MVQRRARVAPSVHSDRGRGAEFSRWTHSSFRALERGFNDAGDITITADTISHWQNVPGNFTGLETETRGQGDAGNITLMLAACSISTAVICLRHRAVKAAVVRSRSTHHMRESSPLMAPLSVRAVACTL